MNGMQIGDQTVAVSSFEKREAIWQKQRVLEIVGVE